jgi:hypothetical protein
MGGAKTAILTGRGGPLGSGHYERMRALCADLEKHNGTAPYIYETDRAQSLPEDYPIFKEKPDLIIRDMRDSSVREINALRKIAPVLAVDDIGPGREYADRVIDLLPNELHSQNSSHYRPDCFLFGKSFSAEISAIEKHEIEKDIDLTFYPGYEPADGYIEQVVSSFKTEIVIGLLQGVNSCILRGQSPSAGSPINSGYALTLLRSKVFLTHFGISLFEAAAAGCTVFTANPGDYHNMLTGLLDRNENIINLGVSEEIDWHKAAEKITGTISQKKNLTADPFTIRHEINCKTCNFIKFLESI